MGRQACGFFAKEQAGTLKPNDIYLFRVAAMLGEYQAHGAVLRRYSRSVSKLDAPGAEVIAAFQAHLRSAGRSVSTVRTYGTLAGEFVAFTATRGGLACCDAATISAFVATLAGYQYKTVEQKLCAVRSFLRFASGAGLVDAGCLDTVPGGALVPAGQDPVGVRYRVRSPGSWRRSTGTTRAGNGITRSSCWSPGWACTVPTVPGARVR